MIQLTSSPACYGLGVTGSSSRLRCIDPDTVVSKRWQDIDLSRWDVGGTMRKPWRFWSPGPGAEGEARVTRGLEHGLRCVRDGIKTSCFEFNSVTVKYDQNRDFHARTALVHVRVRLCTRT